MATGDTRHQNQGADPSAGSRGARRRREWESGYPDSLRFSRAREYHLYTPEGERYLDCILGGGAAPLGHNPKGLSQAVKNRLSSGPMLPAPGREHGKLRQAVRRLFPSVRWVVPLHMDDLSDTFLDATPLWRPFEKELPAGRLAAGRGAAGSGAPETAPPGSWPQPPGDSFLMVPGFALEPRLILYCGTAHEAPWEGVEAPGARQAEDAASAAAAPGPNPAGVESAGLAEAAAAAAKAAVEAARDADSRARDADSRARDADTGARDTDTGAREANAEAGETNSGAQDTDPRARATMPGARQLSPVLLAGATKAVHLIASAYEGESLPRKLTSHEQDGWRRPLATGEIWERTGIYYRFTGSPELYQKLRTELQECGILVPREPWQPMVLPRIITSHWRSLWDEISSTL